MRCVGAGCSAAVVHRYAGQRKAEEAVSARIIKNFTPDEVAIALTEFLLYRNGHLPLNGKRFATETRLEIKRDWCGKHVKAFRVEVLVEDKA